MLVKYLLFLLLITSNFVYANNERTLDERCDGHANYVMKLLGNRYKGESLAEQIELVNEWSDPVYREEIKNILSGFVYTLPVEYLESDIKYQALHTYIATYRNCIKKYS